MSNRPDTRIRRRERWNAANPLGKHPGRGYGTTVVGGNPDRDRRLAGKARIRARKAARR